jgi:hypothetical protein
MSAFGVRADIERDINDTFAELMNAMRPAGVGAFSLSGTSRIGYSQSMTNPINWDDDTPLPLDDIVRLAFPAGGVTRDTLLRKVRGGRLNAYRPGKAYLTSLRDVRAMIETTRVVVARPSPESTPAVPNALGLTESDLANMRCDHALQEVRKGVDEKKRLARMQRDQDSLRRKAERDAERRSTPHVRRRSRSV